MIRKYILFPLALGLVGFSFLFHSPEVNTAKAQGLPFLAPAGNQKIDHSFVASNNQPTKERVNNGSRNLSKDGRLSNAEHPSAGKKPAQGTHPAAPEPGQQRKVKAHLFVHSSPRMDNHIGILKPNDLVTVKEVSKDKSWCKIGFNNDPNAWVECRYLVEPTAQVGYPAAEQKTTQGTRPAAPEKKPAQGTHPAALEQGQQKRVKTSLNVRSSPAMGNNRIGVLQPNTLVTIKELSKDNFWCKIDFKNYDNAWVACRFLQEPKVQGTHPAAPEPGQQKSVKTSLNVRSSPAMGNNRIGVLQPNTLVTIKELSKDNFWCKIDFKDYANAWVACRFLQEPKAQAGHPAAEKKPATTHPAAPEPGQQKSVKTSLNVRSSPAMGDNRIGVLQPNALVTVKELSQDKFWCKIDFQNAPNAWVACRFLQEPKAQTEHPAAPEPGQQKSVKTQLNVRSAPSMGDNRIGVLQPNALVTVKELSQDKFWCKIDFQNAPNAWVACRFLQEPKAQTEHPAAPEPGQQKSAKTQLNVRSSPSMGNNRIDFLVPNQVIKVIELSPNKIWCKIDFKNYDNAWVACRFLE